MEANETDDEHEENSHGSGSGPGQRGVFFIFIALTAGCKLPLSS